jgi:hypothetical protein
VTSPPRWNEWPARSFGWFVLREKYCWLVVDGWFVLREKHCWPVADKPNQQDEWASWRVESIVVDGQSHHARSTHALRIVRSNSAARRSKWGAQKGRTEPSCNGTFDSLSSYFSIRPSIQKRTVSRKTRYRTKQAEEKKAKKNCTVFHTA